jgi:hypothetical protein
MFKSRMLDFNKGAPLGYVQLFDNRLKESRRDYYFLQSLQREGLFDNRKDGLQVATLMGMVNVFLLHFARYGDGREQSSAVSAGSQNQC